MAPTIKLRPLHDCDLLCFNLNNALAYPQNGLYFLSVHTKREPTKFALSYFYKLCLKNYGFDIDSNDYRFYRMGQLKFCNANQLN